MQAINQIMNSQLGLFCKIGRAAVLKTSSPNLYRGYISLLTFVIMDIINRQQ
jgi:hypothetical protein